MVMSGYAGGGAWRDGCCWGWLVLALGVWVGGCMRCPGQRVVIEQQPSRVAPVVAFAKLPPKDPHEWILLSPNDPAFVDTRRIVTAEGDAVVRLRDLETGEVLRTFEGHRSTVWAVAVSPDGGTLASASGSHVGESDFTVRLWDMATGEQRRVLPIKDVPANVAFSPDGRLLATADRRGNLVLWNLESGERFDAPQSKRWSPAVFSPDGQYVFGGTTLWRIAGRSPLKVERVGQRYLQAFSVDGVVAYHVRNNIMSSSGQGVKQHAAIMEAAFPEGTARRCWELRHMRMTTYFPRIAASSVSGRVAYYSTYGIFVYDLRQGRVVAELVDTDGGPSLDVISARFSGDGDAVVAATRKGVRVWRVPRGEAPR